MLISHIFIEPPAAAYPSEQSDLGGLKYGGIRASRAIGDLSIVVSDALEEGPIGGGVECSEEVFGFLRSKNV